MILNRRSAFTQTCCERGNLLLKVSVFLLTLAWVTPVWMSRTPVASAQEAGGAKKENTVKKRPGLHLSGTEKGLFKIFVEGKQKGTEEFEIGPQGTNFAAKGKIALAILRDEKPIHYSIETELILKPNFDPVRYRLTQKFEENVAGATMEFNPGKTTAEFKMNTSVEQREYQLAPDVALLDDNVFHHYLLLARRYDFDRGGLQEFSAFVPQESLGGILRILDKGDEKTEVGGKMLAVRHLVVDTNDLKLDLFLEGPQHRLIKLQVPSSNVVVIREPGVTGTE